MSFVTLSDWTYYGLESSYSILKTKEILKFLALNGFRKRLKSHKRNVDQRLSIYIANCESEIQRISNNA